MDCLLPVEVSVSLICNTPVETLYELWMCDDYYINLSVLLSSEDARRIRSLLEDVQTMTALCDTYGLDYLPFLSFLDWYDLKYVFRNSSMGYFQERWKLNYTALELLNRVDGREDIVKYMMNSEMLEDSYEHRIAATRALCYDPVLVSTYRYPFVPAVTVIERGYEDLYLLKDLRNGLYAAAGMCKWNLVRSIVNGCSDMPRSIPASLYQIMFMYNNHHLIDEVPDDIRQIFLYTTDQSRDIRKILMLTQERYLSVEKLMTLDRDRLVGTHNDERYSVSHCWEVTPNSLKISRWLISIGVNINRLGFCGFIISREDRIECDLILNDLLDEMEDDPNWVHTFLKYLHEKKLHGVETCVHERLVSFTGDHEAVMYWIREFSRLVSLKDDLLDMCDDIETRGSRYEKWLESL